MNESTAQVLNAIAEKLGTTTEHLWAALIAQAPIDGIATLVQIAILSGVTALMVRLTRKAWTGFDENPGPTIVCCIGWIPVALTWVSAFFYLPTLAAAFLNPDYWALKEILDAFKSDK